MSEITLYEYEPTRSQKCHWALREAGLNYESVGNSPEVMGSQAVQQAHPLGKLPVAIIDGKPLFESSVIVAAVADCVPERKLIAPPGSWERHLHNQWTAYAHTELELWAWGGMLNTWEFFLPEDQRVPEIVGQQKTLFSRGASGLEKVLADADYLVGGAFSVTDINMGYALNLGRGMGFLTDEFPRTNAYLDRLHIREHCKLTKPTT